MHKKKAITKQLNQQIMTMQNLTPYFFIAPVILGLLILVVYPLFKGIYVSFFITDLSKKWDFVGLKNYANVFKETGFINSVIVTCLFTLVVVAGHFFIGTISALAVNNCKNKSASVFKTILILPWFFSDVVIALIFKWILNPNYGLANYTLKQLGVINKSVSWFGSTKYAFWAVTFVCIWKGFPLVFINIHAALQSVPNEICEAAKVDGASSRKIFFCVILPYIKPVIASTVILDTIWWFKHYTIVELLTSGGPNSTTNVLSIEIYKKAFANYNFGEASAMAVFVFVICFIISKVFRRLLADD